MNKPRGGKARNVISIPMTAVQGGKKIQEKKNVSQNIIQVPVGNQMNQIGSKSIPVVPNPVTLITKSVAKTEEIDKTEKTKPIFVNQARLLWLHENFNEVKLNRWHKVIIPNGKKFPKQLLLSAVVNSVLMNLLVPCQINQHGDNINFLCDSKPVIRKFLQNNFVIILPGIGPITIEIILNILSKEDLVINIDQILLQCIEKKFNKATGHLNLSEFHLNPDFKDIYFHLSCVEHRKHLFVMLTSFQGIKYLDCSSNFIERIMHFNLLPKTITSINFRFNRIANFVGFKELGHIREIYLDNNPLCQDFRDTTVYIKSVKFQLPNLRKLDGCELSSIEFFPSVPFPSHRNTLCDIKGYQLVDQFLSHFFPLYDSEDRRLLKDMYHYEAMFSLSTCTGTSVAVSPNYSPLLQSYATVSRNLLKTSDIEKANAHLYIGPYKIIELLTSLSKTEHIPCSFYVDLLYYQPDKYAVIVVKGLFIEDPAANKRDQIISFNRMFALYCEKNNEFKIVSDMLQLFPMTASQYQELELYKSIQQKIDKEGEKKKERAELEEKFGKITGMNKEWALKCLTEMKFDIKKALTVFARLYEVNMIPPEAFK